MEASSDQTYSREVLDKSKFEEVDYYAYCMVRLLRINSGHRNGIFFRRQLNDEEKEARIWMAILRATNDRSKARWESGRTTTKESELATKVQTDIFADSPDTPTKPTSSTLTKTKPTSSTKQQSTVTSSTDLVQGQSAIRRMTMVRMTRTRMRMRMKMRIRMRMRMTRMRMANLYCFLIAYF